MKRIRTTKKNRQTGTTIDVIDRGRDDQDDNRWETICVDHGTVCSHPTRELALSFSAAPLEWCELCMEVEHGS